MTDTPRPATRPFCGCPVDGYAATCHRGDHRANAADGMTDGPTTADGAPVAVDRDPSEPCEAGTPGCCVRHNDRADRGCDTW